MTDDHTYKAGIDTCPSTTKGPLASIPTLNATPKGSDHAVTVPDSWRAKNGDSLAGETLTLRISGNLSGPKLLVLGGISATRFVGTDDSEQQAWWPNIVGPRGAIDLTH